MRVVVDLGCRDLGGPDSSFRWLVDQYQPALFFGFDPNVREKSWIEGDSVLILSRKVAWTRGGTVSFAGELYRAHVSQGDGEQMACFDFSAWLQALPACELIVKMNIEGAEYPILSQMYRDGSDQLVDLLLVQWHDKEMANGWQEATPQPRCEMREWHGAPA